MRIKDPFSGISHLVGLVLAVIGLIFLIMRTQGDMLQLTSMIIYGASLIILYSASSIYHLANTSERITKILRKVDHVAIFILIAGCYTPIFSLKLEGGWRLGMLIAVWTIALAGIILKTIWISVPRRLSTILYLAMGWIAIVPFYQLLQALPAVAIILMLVGGVFYTIGAVIYATKKLNFFPDIFGFHEIFHLCVLAGSIVHYWLMYRYITV